MKNMDICQHVVNNGFLTSVNRVYLITKEYNIICVSFVCLLIENHKNNLVFIFQEFLWPYFKLLYNINRSIQSYKLLSVYYYIIDKEECV